MDFLRRHDCARSQHRLVGTKGHEDLGNAVAVEEMSVIAALAAKHHRAARHDGPSVIVGKYRHQIGRRLRHPFEDAGLHRLTPAIGRRYPTSGLHFRDLSGFGDDVRHADTFLSENSGSAASDLMSHHAEQWPLSRFNGNNAKVTCARDSVT